MSDDDEDDEALVARAGEGDRLAASVLVARHSSKVHGVCRRILRDRASAEDAAQETFMRLWENAARWRPKGARLDTWLYRIAVNACLDRLRRKKREPVGDIDDDHADDSPSAEQNIAAEDRRRAVDAALEALPERQRIAVTLRHYQELSQIDAAAAMAISVDALESLLARARRTLKVALIADKAELMEGIS